MKEQIDTRRPEEIESDIERTRADLSSTVDAIQNKLAPSELRERAVNYALQTPPVAYGIELVNMVRDNPVPFALIGIGVAWLMASDDQPGSRARLARQRSARRTAYYPDVESAYDREADYAGDAYVASTGVADSGDGVLRRAASRTSEAGQQLKSKASDVGQRISGSASEMSARAREKSALARARLHESAESARMRMSDMGQRSQEQYYRAKDRVDQLIDEQPLVIGALGIAIGAALGATLPNTRREDELMGRTRDDLLGRARETAREQAESVKQTAQRVAEVAKQEAGRAKENVANAVKQGATESGLASSGTLESTQFGTMSGQQLPH